MYATATKCRNHRSRWRYTRQRRDNAECRLRGKNKKMRTAGARENPQRRFAHRMRQVLQQGKSSDSAAQKSLMLREKFDDINTETPAAYAESAVSRQCFCRAFRERGSLPAADIGLGAF